MPLFPYFFINSVQTALYVSIAVTVTALFIFGFLKTRFLGIRGRIVYYKAFQTALVGVIAAAVAFGVAKAIPLKY